jgi:hypothetical protein
MMRMGAAKLHFVCDSDSDETRRDDRRLMIANSINLLYSPHTLFPLTIFLFTKLFYILFSFLYSKNISYFPNPSPSFCFAQLYPLSNILSHLVIFFFLINILKKIETKNNDIHYTLLFGIINQ